MARLNGPRAAVEGMLLEDAVRKALVEKGWEVEDQPVLGTVRPDFLARTPGGETLVIELRSDQAPVHFATVAQVAAYARLAEDARDLHPVTGVLMAAAPSTAAARDAASKLGVLIVEPQLLGPPDELANHRDLADRWVDAITRHLRPSDGTGSD